MKALYETPVVELVNFAAMETIAAIGAGGEEGSYQAD